MTRGNFVLITNDANWMSLQFNGDMYPSYNGKIVYHMLKNVNDYDDLAAAIKKFDKEHFGYGENDGYMADLTPRRIDDKIDFSGDYFATYNSDYLYIKNASDKQYTIHDRSGNDEVIKPGEVQIWNFGNIEKLSEAELRLTEEEKRSFIPENDNFSGDLSERLEQLYRECGELLDNLPNELTAEEKVILAAAVSLRTAIQYNLKK